MAPTTAPVETDQFKLHRAERPHCRLFDGAPLDPPGPGKNVLFKTSVVFLMPKRHVFFEENDV